MTRTQVSGIAAVALAVALAGCSTGSTPSPATTPTSAAATSAARPTLTAAALQPPSQDATAATRGGRPKVTFDPCTWIPDDVIARAGYDPASRKRGRDMLAEYTFLTCNFKSPNRTLQVDSGNVTWSEDRQKYTAATLLSINGRDALWTNDRTYPDMCEIHLRTTAGFVRVAAILTDKVSVTEVNPCDGLQDTATAIEPTIGPDA
ncbi:DUF3558 domain-containing protein [Nocardia sp. NPDC051570]|uniref:DUF3558 domain-containing protein n=1 Tax=Nocardia sp. NPDC051570 TaxID=3364324 RepID=UPI0037A730E3